MTLLADRRQFLAASLGVVATAAVSKSAVKAPALKKALKYGMIGVRGSVEDRFRAAKEAGFDGVEMDSPGAPAHDEVVRARDKTGLDVHGVVDSIHWNIRLSDPSAEVRAKGLAGLQTALKDCKAFGGTTVLLVPGAVRHPENENYDQVWERSAAEIKKAMPLAKELNVKIGIETVWNDFITKPEQFVAYIDQFGDAIVGGYFDISNMIKYGPSPAEWIRALGKRMIKFDFKGYSRKNQWCAIGDGDEDWPEVLKALAEVGYTGYATAEVSGGGPDVLKDIAGRMNRVLGLGG